MSVEFSGQTHEVGLRGRPGGDPGGQVAGSPRRGCRGRSALGEGLDALPGHVALHGGHLAPSGRRAGSACHGTTGAATQATTERSQRRRPLPEAGAVPSPAAPRPAWCRAARPERRRRRRRRRQRRRRPGCPSTANASRPHGNPPKGTSGAQRLEEHPGRGHPQRPRAPGRPRVSDRRRPARQAVEEPPRGPTSANPGVDRRSPCIQGMQDKHERGPEDEAAARSRARGRRRAQQGERGHGEREQPAPRVGLEATAPPRRPAQRGRTALRAISRRPRPSARSRRPTRPAVRPSPGSDGAAGRPQDATRARALRTDPALAGCEDRDRCLLGRGLFVASIPHSSTDVRRAAVVHGSWYPTGSRGHRDASPAVACAMEPAEPDSRRPAGVNTSLTCGVLANAQVSEGRGHAQGLSEFLRRCGVSPADTPRTSGGLDRDHDGARCARGGDQRLVEQLRGRRALRVGRAPGDHPDRKSMVRGPGADPDQPAVTSSTSPARTGARNCTSE